MKEKLSIDDVAEIVECEGLGYAILHFLSAHEIEDSTLRKLWKDAEEILTEIEKKLDAG